MFKFLTSWVRGWTTPASSRAADSLDAFGSEQSGGGSLPPPPVFQFSVPHPGLALALLIAIAASASGYLWQKWPFSVEAASASLTIESDPAGAEVFAAGLLKGTTPLTLNVNPGEHAFELVYEGVRKPLHTVARAGAAVVHHVELEVPEPAATTSALRIMTEPANLQVRVNGRSLGRSPLTASGLQPGAHRVQVIGTTGMLERKVEVRAGETASVIIAAGGLPAPAPAGPRAGWLAVVSPIAMQILAGNDLIGTSQSSKIMLPAGRHELRLTNEALGLSLRRDVEVTSGRVAVLRVAVPSAPLNINALPWAEAWIDGVRLGETPIGNHQVAVGTHEVIFRHPELGERRQMVTVTLTEPARVSVDMRKQK